MASAKKKLDEYHLKILRQLVTLPSNKECFDCHQRGPTYVNVTIGSFVCTSCSGMLRGLTPPHRVKSISMATFTPDEVDFVKARGNEYCRKTWLGLLDSQPPTKDEQQVKDFMIAKYERKRYYLDPALDSTISKAVNGNSPSPSKPSTPSEAAHTVPALPTHTSVHPHPHPRTLAFKAPVSQPKSNNEFTPEPFADFSNLSIPPPCDPFNNSQSAAAPAQPSFANFDNNPVFNNSGSTGMPGVGEAGTVPGEDRYAALKDLDCLMKSQQTTDTPPPPPPTEWSAGVSSNGMTSVWSAPTLFPAPAAAAQAPDNLVSNPFKGGGTWNVDSVSGSANPFRNIRTDAVWSNLSNGQMVNGFTTSQSLNFTVPKTLRTNDAISNPFVIGPGPQVSGHHSSNPFL